MTAGKKLPIPADLSGGLTGFLSRTEKFSTPIGGTIQSPLNVLPDVKNNQAYCAFFHYPAVPKDYVFPARLLPSTHTLHLHAGRMNTSWTLKPRRARRRRHDAGPDPHRGGPLRPQTDADQ